MKPCWLKIPLPSGGYDETKRLLSSLNVVTVCKEAKCPNVNECWGNGTATFMVLGRTCTRGCRFCNTKTALQGDGLDAGEANRIAEAVVRLGLKYVVITSVDRDDLEDLGAGHFAHCISTIKRECEGVRIEVLTPDFQGRRELIDLVCGAGPDVFGHNIETVRRLTPKVRDLRASYEQSLSVLRHVSDRYPHIIVKSAIMVGLGESEGELCEALADLKGAGVTAVAIGQYLRPTPKHYPVAEYVRPEQFEKYAKIAKGMGFKFVASGPFVRSSYRAWEVIGHKLQV
ncbi:MAG: lipoyl synthase [Candidatus Micrarchaeota archaeon]|nr:lipoyl synthase [Candidatus Micrarchaeota archaeon]